MSDAFWQYAMGTIGLIAIAWMNHRAVAAARDAAAKAEQVRLDLKVQDAIENKKLDDIAATTKETKSVTHDVHTLVNNQMGVQLRINAVNCRRIANMTSNPNPEDIAAAELAEKLLEEHDAKQAVVDAKTVAGAISDGSAAKEPT